MSNVEAKLNLKKTMMNKCRNAEKLRELERIW